MLLCTAAYVTTSAVIGSYCSYCCYIPTPTPQPAPPKNTTITTTTFAFSPAVRYNIFDEAIAEVLHVMEVNFKADFERTLEFRTLSKAVEREARELQVLRQVTFTKTHCQKDNIKHESKRKRNTHAKRARVSTLPPRPRTCGDCCVGVSFASCRPGNMFHEWQADENKRRYGDAPALFLALSFVFFFVITFTVQLNS